MEKPPCLTSNKDLKIVGPACDLGSCTVEKEKTANGEVSESGLMVAKSSCAYKMEEEIHALCQFVPEVDNHFTILNKIGEGAFSSVYQAKLKHYPEVSEAFALKHIVPISHPSRIENELRCLLNIGGQDNVMGVKLCLRNRDHVIIVMPLFPHDKFQDYLPLMSVTEVKEYMKNLLLALRRVHLFKVIHRDIKPSNFLFNRKHKRYALVDFGLASGSMLTHTDGESPEVSNRKSAEISATPCIAGGGRGGARGRIPLSPLRRGAADRNKTNILSTTDSVKWKGKGVTQTVGNTSKPGRSVSKNGHETKMERLRQGLCDCYGRPVICQLCAGRSNQLAPRAGTAGFRAPEVLMKSPNQDTGVDIWSAGVIFLSLLSTRYPFFRAQDDMGYLAQIIALLGSDACIKAADSFNKLLTLSEEIPAVDLRSACIKLRKAQLSLRTSGNANKSSPDTSWNNVSSEPFDLLSKMLDPNPLTRITAEKALLHPFFTNHLTADT